MDMSPSPTFAPSINPRKFAKMNPKLIAFFLAAALVSCDDTISEFQSENFVKYFGSGYESRGFDVAALSDGNYVFTGYDKREAADDQLLIVKVDENGNQIWSGTYGQAGVDEKGWVVKEVSDGLLIAGVADSAGFSRPFIFKAGPGGDSLWYRSFGRSEWDIEVQDFVLDDTHMYVVGYSLQVGKTRTDYYAAKLTLGGDLIWERNYFENSGSLFRRVILLGEHFLLVGDDGHEKSISIATVAKGSGMPTDFDKLETKGETLADVLLIGSALYALANTASGTLLYKLNSAYEVEWQTAPVSSITGKAVVQNKEGTFLVLGESTEIGNKLINTISIDVNGQVTGGPEFFRTISGTISRVRTTGDNGLIITGSTNATYGTKAQLIKTGADLFLLKP
jgi:hypothetical protein